MSVDGLRCGRCDEPLVAIRTDRYHAAPPKLCNGCGEIAAENNIALRIGRHTFWRFSTVDADEPVPFVVTLLDESHIQADFADRPYHRGWLKYSAFPSRNAALMYRIDRLDAQERRHAEAVEAARLVLDRLRSERHARYERRERLVQQMHQAMEPVEPEPNLDDEPRIGHVEQELERESPMTTALVAALRARQGASGFCEVSKAELARELACPQQTVDAAIWDLIQSGRVTRAMRPGYKNRYSVVNPNAYTRATLRLVPSPSIEVNDQNSARQS